jgi:hypothetical protein
MEEKIRTVEVRVRRRVEEVGASVAANAVVACGVHADVLVDEVALDQAVVLLVAVLEGGNKDIRLEGVDVVTILQKVRHDLVCGAH